MKANLDALDPEALLRQWMPAGVQGFEQMQQMFWAQMGAAAAPDTDTDKD